MRKQKNSDLTFTINVKDFTNNEDIINYLFEAVKTSLELNNDNKFLEEMKVVDGLNLSLKKNLNISINDCSCN